MSSICKNAIYIGEELKAKGNEAFKAKDYETAINYYTEAINVDENNHV